MPDSFTNWLKFTPAGVPSYRRSYIDLPSFSYSGLSWSGASVIVAQFNFSATSNFILLNRPSKPLNVNYGLCVRYRVGETVYRYKLWQDTNFVLNDDGAPLYNGQLIKKNFVLEIWSLNGQSAASQASSIRMFSSLRALPTDINVTTDYALAVGAEFTNLQNSAPTMPAGVTLRWNAATVADGAVSSWIDSILGLSLAQATTGDQPTKIAADSSWLNGRVSFPLAGNKFLSVVLSTLTIETFSIYLVGAFDFGSGGESSLSLESGGVSFVQLKQNLFSNKFKIGSYTILESIDATVARVFRATYNKTSGVQGKSVDDGAYNTIARSPKPVLATPLTLNVGASIVDGTYGALELADLLIFNNKILTDAEDLQLRQYLRNYHFGEIPIGLSFDAGGSWLDNV